MAPQTGSPASTPSSPATHSRPRCCQIWTPDPRPQHPVWRPRPTSPSALEDLFNDLDELSRALKDQTETVACHTPDHAPPHSIYHLGALHGSQFQHSNLDADLDAAIHLYEKATEMFSPSDELFPYALADLGNMLHIRHTRLYRFEDLTRAIGLLRRAFTASSDERLRTYILESLGCATEDMTVILVNRFFFNSEKNLALLEDAMSAHRSYMQLCPHTHPSRVLWATRAARCGIVGFTHTGERSSISEALALSREAVSLAPEGHEHRGMAVFYLGYAIYMSLDMDMRPHTMHDIRVVDEMMALFRECLNILPPGHRNRGDVLSFLADGITIRSRILPKSLDWPALISLRKQALDESPAEQRHQCLYAAALDIFERFPNDAQPQEVEQATVFARQALDIMRAGHPARFMAYHCLSLACLRHNDIVQAINYAFLMAHDDMGNVRDRVYHSLKFLLELHPLVIASSSAALPHASMAQLLDVYRQTMSLPPRMAFRGVGITSRLAELVGLETLGRDAAVLALRMGRADLAAQALEEGRCMFWAQALHLRPRLDGLPDPLARELKGLARALEAASFRQVEQADVEAEAQRRRQSARFDELVDEARKLPGMERFMRCPEYSTFSAAATRSNGPIVLLLAGIDDCHAIVIKSDQTPLHVCLPSLRPQDVEAWGRGFKSDSMAYRAELRNNGNASRLTLIKMVAPRNAQATEESLAVLACMWTSLVRPIVDALDLPKRAGRERPRVTWIPTGAFAFVPVHAAGVYTNERDCCSDYFVSSYSPTIGALCEAQQNLAPIRQADAKVLLAAAPCPKDQGWQRLPFTVEELRAITSVVPAANIVPIPPEDHPMHSTHGGASVATTLANLPDATIAHFACHGCQNAANPLQSGFMLRDDVLTIAKLMPTYLPNAFLAFLSACETAKGDAGHPDQIVHLAAAMLFAGFKSVIATLWSMGDVDGPLVAKRIYSELFKTDAENLDTAAIPYALDAAVEELRGRDPRPSRWAPYIHIGC